MGSLRAPSINLLPLSLVFYTPRQLFSISKNALIALLDALLGGIEEIVEQRLPVLPTSAGATVAQVGKFV